MSEKAEQKRRRKETARVIGKALEGQAAFILLTISEAGEISISTDLNQEMAVLVMKRAITRYQDEKDEELAEARKKIILASR